MKRPRPPKKTESLEVRLPHAVKHALMAKAHREGRSASAVIRDLIDLYLADVPPRSEPRTMIKRLTKPAAAASLAASLLAVYAVTPAAVSAAPDLKAMFEALDRNRDGAVSLDEFVRREGDTIFVRADAPKTEGATPFVLPLRHSVPPPAGNGVPPEAQTMLRRHFGEHDVDKSGQVSFAEFEAHHRSTLRGGFDGLDANHDGAIERSEYHAGTALLPKHSHPEASPFELIDRDGDGRISWEEFLS